MNIFFINPHNRICGGNKVVLEYCNHLAERFQKCFVISDDEPPSWMRANAFFLDRKTALELILPEDIVIFHWDDDAAYTLETRALRKIYLIQHFVHEEERLFKLAFEFISVSTYIQQHTKKTYGIDSELVLNAIDHGVFNSRPIQREPGRIFAIDLGGWKGVRDVRKAEKLLKRRLPRLKFVYKHGLTPQAMAEEYSRAEVFVSASWYEGFGLPPLEAMACGCAVVCTDSKGVDDFAVHGETCIKIPPKNPAAMARGIEQLVTDSSLRGQLCAHGLETALRFTWDASITHLAKVLGLKGLIETEELLRSLPDVGGIVYGDLSDRSYGEPVCCIKNPLASLKNIKGGSRLLVLLRRMGISEYGRKGVFDYGKVQFIQKPPIGGMVINPAGRRWLYVPYPSRVGA